MRKRTGKGLLDLDGNWRAWIIGQAMILAAQECEFCLQEKVITGYDASIDRRYNGPAHRCFVVVPALVRRIDATKANCQSHFREGLRGSLFPSSSIN